jgi:hypothetical protein
MINISARYHRDSVPNLLNGSSDVLFSPLVPYHDFLADYNIENCAIRLFFRIPGSQIVIPDFTGSNDVFAVRLQSIP